MVTLELALYFPLDIIPLGASSHSLLGMVTSCGSLRGGKLPIMVSSFPTFRLEMAWEEGVK